MTVTMLGVKVLITWILYVGYAVAIDTVFGLGRAIKHRKWNSSFGINGSNPKDCHDGLHDLYRDPGRRVWI